MIHDISYPEVNNGIDPKEYDEIQNLDWAIVNNDLLQFDTEIPE